MSNLPLAGKCVVMGVTGGIAAYKAAEVLRLLQKQGADVYVIMTEHACQFLTPLTMETLSGHPVVSDMFARVTSWEVEHISLAKRADLFLIVPATANIMGKMASGIADDMLSTTVMATHAPVLLAPAMNTGMWENAATQSNLQTLRARGVQFVMPENGRLACGDTGAGKLAPVEDIAAQAVRLFAARQDYSGLRVMVTAGPTREPIDPVRYLSNRSSGKMGYAIAQAAAARGAQVTLLTGPVNLTPPAGVQVHAFQTTMDLLALAQEHAPQQDVVIQAAAPGDYRAEIIAGQKIKKHDGDDGLTIHFVENPDVAATLGRQKKPGQTFVGFAAETQKVTEHAQEKLHRKNVDLIVANDVTKPGAGFDVDTNIITLITREEMRDLPLMQKREAADAILDAVLELRKTE